MAAGTSPSGPPGGPSGPIALGDVVIVGGGCYGRFYAGQLLRARARSAATWRRLLVVDRDPRCRVGRELAGTAGVVLVVQDWAGFFDAWLAGSQPADRPPDTIVPSPLMPHLMFDWLLRRARTRWPARTVERCPLPIGPGTPYDVAAPDGTRGEGRNARRRCPELRAERLREHRHVGSKLRTARVIGNGLCQR